MSSEQHKQSADAIVAQVAVLTLSDTRNRETDVSGQTIRRMLVASGHRADVYQIIPDGPDRLGEILQQWLADPAVDAIITNGGTGISRRDCTIPTIALLLDSELPGFGELFRMLSYEQVQSSALLSRAIAGIAKGKPVFALPGSTRAVELAMDKLILPELKHLLRELRK